MPRFSIVDSAKGMRNDVDKGLITDFPSALAIAATWDKDASYLYAKTMANEFSSKGAKI